MKNIALNSLRKQIDCCDDLLVKLLSQRFDYVSQIQKFKKELELPTLDDARFERILKRVRKSSKEEGLDPNMIEGVFKEIHLYSSKKRDDNTL